MLCELLGLRRLDTLGRLLLGGGNVVEVTFERYFECHALRAAALDIHTPYHFIFDAS